MTHIQANSSPKEAYAYVYADPVIGTLAANSEYARAVNMAAIAPIRNDIRIPGPVDHN